MADKNAREQLVQLLDRKAFDPILHKSADDFSGGQRDKFEDVKKSTESEKHRFHEEYTSAEDVKENYLSDLHSSTGKKKTDELHDLGLPTLADIEAEFKDLANQLGV